jgi:hypothetical protein
VSAWQRSELSAADFGRKHGVNAQRLAWWRWKLAAEPAAFVPVEVMSSPSTTVTTPAAVEIHVAGKVLVVQPDFDAATLRRLLAVLEEAV